MGQCEAHKDGESWGRGQGILSWSVARATHGGGLGGYSEIPSREAPLGPKWGVSLWIQPWDPGVKGCRIRVNPTWVQLRNSDWENFYPGCSSGLNDKVKREVPDLKRDDQNEILV